MGPREREDASGTSRCNQCRAANGGEGTGARREATPHKLKLERETGFEPATSTLEGALYHGLFRSAAVKLHRIELTQGASTRHLSTDELCTERT